MFNEKLRQLRKERKITQKELSNILGIAQTTYAGYETGRYEPDFKILVVIADFFKVSTDYLLGRYDNNQIAK